MKHIIKDPYPGPRPEYRKRYKMSAEQLAWLTKWYARRPLADLSASTGVSAPCLRRIIREQGLQRTPTQAAKVRSLVGRRTAKTSRKRGLYDNRQPSAACFAGRARYYADVRAGKRESGWARICREEPQRAEVLRRQRRETMTEVWRRAKRNHLYGIRDNYKLHAVAVPYTKWQSNLRYEAANAGYWWAEDLSDEGGYRYNIYWDNDTERNERLERNLLHNGFTVLDGRDSSEQSATL